MTHVVERIVVRTSTDLIDAIGKPVTSSVSMYLRGGGLFHALVVGGTTAVYWERNENRFRTIEIDPRDFTMAEREWGDPQGRRPTMIGHNVMCSCSECQKRAFAPPVPAPQDDAPAPAADDAPAPAADDEPTGRFVSMHGWAAYRADQQGRAVADLQLAVSALVERVSVLEHELAALRARPSAS